MPNEHASKLLRDFKASADVYAKKCTALSNALEEIELFLQELPAKFELVVTSDDFYELSFQRIKGVWRLYIAWGDEVGVSVTEASVETKAKAAKLLPRLVNQLVEEQQERLQAVDEGLKSLQEIPFVQIREESTDDLS